MHHNGAVIDRAVIATEAEASDTFSKILESDRFEWCELINATRSWRVWPFGLFQGIDESGDPLSPGYVRDTQVTVVGAEGILPGGHSLAIVQPQIKVFATRVRCSARVSFSDGSNDHTLTFQDAVCTPDEIAQGIYFGGVSFSITGGRKNPAMRIALHKSRKAR